MTKKVEIFTDGACRGNPGPGGWAAILRYQDKEKHISDAEILTTNNRMELLAAINALSSLKNPCAATVTTDSRYLKDGVTKWLFSWKKNGWRTAAKQEVKNKDLWQRLDELIQLHHVEWHWVKAHNGHLENELADRLANKAIDHLLQNEHP